MFSSFSWIQFIQVLMAVLFCYYATVLLLFYRVELSAVIAKFTAIVRERQAIEISATPVVACENKKSNDTDLLTLDSIVSNTVKQSISDRDISNMYALLEEVIDLASNQSYLRQDLLISLRAIIGKCIYCQDTDLSKAINSYIQTHLTIHSLEVLNTQELSQIWSN